MWMIVYDDECRSMTLGFDGRCRTIIDDKTPQRVVVEGGGPHRKREGGKGWGARGLSAGIGYLRFSDYEQMVANMEIIKRAKSWII